MVFLAADRMARTPVNLNPGWGSLSHELILSSSVRTALRYGGFKVGARALYHAAWQFFTDRWLNITPRSLIEPLGAATSDGSNEDMALRTVLDSIETVQVRDVGRHTREYLNAGFSGTRLLSDMGRSILRDDNGWNLVHSLRIVFDEWTLCDGHPARNQLLIVSPAGAEAPRRHVGAPGFARCELVITNIPYDVEPGLLPNAARRTARRGVRRAVAGTGTRRSRGFAGRPPGARQPASVAALEIARRRAV